MQRRLKQADRRRWPDEKRNPHIARGRSQAVVFESRNEIIDIGVGDAARKVNLRSAREDLTLSEAYDLVRKVFVDDNQKRGFDELKGAKRRRTRVFIVQPPARLCRHQLVQELLHLKGLRRTLLAALGRNDGDLPNLQIWRTSRTHRHQR